VRPMAPRRLVVQGKPQGWRAIGPHQVCAQAGENIIPSLT